MAEIVAGIDRGHAGRVLGKSRQAGRDGSGGQCTAPTSSERKKSRQKAGPSAASLRTPTPATVRAWLAREGEGGFHA